jgi:hypothetical protein
MALFLSFIDLKSNRLIAKDFKSMRSSLACLLSVMTQGYCAQAQLFGGRMGILPKMARSSLIPWSIGPNGRPL